jgi:hypothetical protein
MKGSAHPPRHLRRCARRVESQPHPRGPACRACADTAHARRMHGLQGPVGGGRVRRASRSSPPSPDCGAAATATPSRDRGQTLGQGPRRAGREAGEDRLHEGLHRPRQGVGGDGDGDVPGGPAGTKVDHRELARLLSCDGCRNDRHAEAAQDQVEQRVDVVDLRGDLAGRARSCEGSLLTVTRRTRCQTSSRSSLLSRPALGPSPRSAPIGVLCLFGREAGTSRRLVGAAHLLGYHPLVSRGSPRDAAGCQGRRRPGRTRIALHRPPPVASGEFVHQNRRHPRYPTT